MNSDRVIPLIAGVGSFGGGAMALGKASSEFGAERLFTTGAGWLMIIVGGLIIVAALRGSD